MTDQINERFIFHGEASAVNGIITAPIAEVIEVQAPVSLPVIGGTARARVSNFAHHSAAGNVLSFAEGTSQAMGYLVKKPNRMAWETVVTSTVERLNILDVITADRLVSRLTSVHPVDGPVFLTAAGSYFDNLRIAGCKVEVGLATDHEGANEFFGSYETGARRSDKGLLSLLAGARAGLFAEETHSIGCTLVTKVQHCENPPFEIERNGKITVPGFGSIYLAELIAKPNERALTMLRVELGCPPSGSVTAGSTRTNGNPSGPQH